MNCEIPPTCGGVLLAEYKFKNTVHIGSLVSLIGHVHIVRKIENNLLILRPTHHDLPVLGEKLYAYVVLSHAGKVDHHLKTVVRVGRLSVGVSVGKLVNQILLHERDFIKEL